MKTIIILAVITALLLAFVLIRFWVFFLKNQNIFNALQAETIHQAGFADAYIAYIKSSTVALSYLSKKTVLGFYFQTLYNRQSESCLNRALFELEQLKMYGDFTSELWRLKNFFITKDLDRHPYVLRQSFELKVGDKVVFTGDLNKVEYLKSMPRFKSKVSDLLSAYLTELLNQEDGYALHDSYMWKTYYEYKRYPRTLDLPWVHYDSLNYMVQRTYKETIKAFQIKIDAIEQDSAENRLKEYEEIEKSFIFYGFKQSNYDRDSTWLRYSIADRMDAWEKELFTIRENLTEKKDAACFSLAKQSTDLDKRHEYFEMIQNKDFKAELQTL